jgi:4-hydroxybenzoate polyprenyltransferase
MPVMLAAFVAFGLCASSVYLLNDLMDIEDDRSHPRKKARPFAAGSLSIIEGVLAIPLLLVLAISIAIMLLPHEFTAVLIFYYALTLSYTFYLKKMMVDVITLAVLYTLRIIAGTFALHLTLTFWMLAFSMFVFLSLALVKRYTELRVIRELGDGNKAPGRGYYASDLDMISSLGGSSGYLSVMVLALYIQDNATAALYSQPKLIWLACPLLLFWISRTWMLAHRGHMLDDPLVFAFKDRISLSVGVLFGLIFWIAT